MNEDLREYRKAYFDVVVEPHEPCKEKETVLPEGSRWVKYDPDARRGKNPSGSGAGSKLSKPQKGKVRRAN